MSVETVTGFVKLMHNKKNCTYYATNDLERLYEDEDAILCDTKEEALAELKQRHPDIDEHYGYVTSDLVVYETPGLLVNDAHLAKEVLIKHGPMPCNVWCDHLKGKEGFVINNDGMIRYDEKIAKSRANPKKKTGARLTIPELHTFLIDLANTVPEGECLILEVYRNKGIKFSFPSDDIHKRALAYTELVIACGDLKNRPDYEKMKVRWNSYTKFGTFKEESLKAVAKLRTLFAD